MNTKHNHNLQVGSLVIAKRATAICDEGEKGVCYEEYRIGDRPGWSFIFEQGGYDGFSPDEVAKLLDLTGEVCAEVADYEFQNVMQLLADFCQGRFAAAWRPPAGEAVIDPSFLQHSAEVAKALGPGWRAATAEELRGLLADGIFPEGWLVVDENGFWDSDEEEFCRLLAWRPVRIEYRYEIEPRLAELGGGWRLHLFENDEEVGGGVFPEGDEGYSEALDEGNAWLATRPPAGE